ncbi:MAG: aromatic hydrocarbon degradation protein [Chitinophagaceae bacterium]|nr:aromatic hydrocarbon degradation protein [Chitinophagaceae bacterium]
MKKIGILLFGLACSQSLLAQIPEDVLKYSWQPVNGTARINAIGGAMGALGGDLSATFTNPAGLGFYKTADLVLSPGFNGLRNKGSFRGTDAKDKKSFFNLGTSGIVGGLNGNGRWTSKAISLAVTTTANFNSHVYYTGKNDFSSFGEQYAAEAAGSGLSLADILNSNSVSLGTRMAVYTFLADTVTLGNNPNPDIVSMALRDNLKNNAPYLVEQSQRIQTTGGITEAAIGYAANMNDKFYIGGSLGIPILRYSKNSWLREADATGNNNNDFNFAELNEHFTTKGTGLNLKLGVIAKPSEDLRLGLAIHTPTWYTLKDSYTADMAVDLDQYRSVPGVYKVSSDLFTGGEAPVYRYELFTPWRFMLSGAFVLREVEDVRQQRGFITADIEYVTHKSNRFRNAEDYDDNGYYDQLNEVIKNYYKNAINFRLGGELKFTTIMVRAGLAYYGSPYADGALKSNKFFLSGGLGYRNAGMYIDLGYVHALQKDVNFPYRLPDKANTFASINGTGSNLMLTIGFKI